MYANPLTYGVEALRTLMYPEAPSAFSFVLADRIDFDAGAVRAIHVRSGLCAGESADDEAGSVGRVS